VAKNAIYVSVENQFLMNGKLNHNNIIKEEENKVGEIYYHKN